MRLHWTSLQTCRPRTAHLNILSNCLFLIALILGLYLRVLESQWDLRLLTVCIAFMVLMFLAVLAIQFYVQLRELVHSLAYLWTGYLLGVVAVHGDSRKTTLLPTVVDDNSTIKELAAMFFYTCVAFKVARLLLQRLCSDYKPHQAPLRSVELFEMLGVSVSFIQFDGSSCVALMGFNASFTICLAALRSKSLWGLVNLGLLGVACCLPELLPQLLPHLHLYPAALITYVLRLAAEPLFDLIFSPLSVEELWWSLLRLSAACRHGLVLLLGLLEVCFCAFCGYFIPQHQEWFVMLPMFALLSLVWTSFHLILLMSCWQFMRRLTACNRTYDSVTSQEQATRMSQIMAAKGLRHFALLAARFVVFALWSTLLLGALSWETRTVLSLTLFVLVWPLELLVWSVLAELGATLGGTCIGYAIVAPAPFLRWVLVSDCLTLSNAFCCRSCSEQMARISLTSQLGQYLVVVVVVAVAVPIFLCQLLTD